MLIITLLRISTITDLLYRKIYNTVLISMFLVTLYLHQNNLPEFFTALLVSTIFIITLYKLKFFAGGDAKLLIILGAIVGYPDLFYLFSTIFIIGGLQAIANKAWLIKRRDNEALSQAFSERVNNKTQKNLPYALSILLGYLIFLLQ